MQKNCPFGMRTRIQTLGVQGSRIRFEVNSLGFVWDAGLRPEIQSLGRKFESLRFRFQGSRVAGWGIGS